jgi:riboflavin synthase
VPKGSVALSGVSLTVVEVRADAFTVHIIPHTWEHTSLKFARIGTAVNLETDLMGKYARQQLTSPDSTSPLTLERLRAAGFIE